MESLVKMHFTVVTVLPEVVQSYTQASIVKRAQEMGAASIKVVNLRDFSTDKHRKVDDKAYGGGPGMVLQIEPLYAALVSLKNDIVKDHGEMGLSKTRILLTDAGGFQWTQQTAQQWLNISVDMQAAEHSFLYSKKTDQPVFTVQPKYEHIIIFAGRYQGVDERFKHFVDETVSVGPYILTGGELPALIIIDSLVRLLPGVLGDSISPLFETTFSSSDDTKPAYPVYSRPARFIATKPDGATETLEVPDYLLKGDHSEIRRRRVQ